MKNYPVGNELSNNKTKQTKISVSYHHTSPLTVLPTLFQPTVGDYLLEKAVVKDGIAPIIWLFKKGGIMQKHNRVVEDGETLYESAKFVSTV